jgi:hypothetical protein
MVLVPICDRLYVHAVDEVIAMFYVLLDDESRCV